MVSLVSLLGVLLLLLAGAVPAAVAQDASPESGLADLGLPTLDVTVSATGYEGIPESLEAGRYLVTVTAANDVGEFGGGVAFIQPAGMTAEDFLAAISALPAEGEEGAGGPPAELYDSLFAGGAYAAAPGQSAEIVLDLPPGEWIAWADDPEAAQEPVVFEVTGEMPADLAEPESGATLTMGEYLIEVTEGKLVSGPQIVKVENVGAQPHFIVAFTAPDDLTEAQIEVVLEEEAAAETTGTPPVYSDLNPEEDFGEGFYTGTQSTGTAIWVPVELEAGTYGLTCFFPDIADGLPHANHGMYTIVEVEE
jgi:hypothetical protein